MPHAKFSVLVEQCFVCQIPSNHEAGLVYALVGRRVTDLAIAAFSGSVLSPAAADRSSQSQRHRPR